MKRTVSVLLIFAILVSLAGCSDEWRRKFIRKKKEVARKPRIWQSRKYLKEPTEALYTKHYNYAIAWLSELAERLGGNNKKDICCIEEALGQVENMQYCLVPDKAKELDKHISRLREVHDTLKKGDLSQANKDYVRSTIEREDRFLRSEFYYSKIKNYMRKSFEEEEDLSEPKEDPGA